MHLLEKSRQVVSPYCMTITIVISIHSTDEISRAINELKLRLPEERKSKLLTGLKAIT
jgi:hypothetical protein